VKVAKKSLIALFFLYIRREEDIDEEKRTQEPQLTFFRVFPHLWEGKTEMQKQCG
jgi:hypothetical protein